MCVSSLRASKILGQVRLLFLSNHVGNPSVTVKQDKFKEEWLKQTKRQARLFRARVAKILLFSSGECSTTSTSPLMVETPLRLRLPTTVWLCRLPGRNKGVRMTIYYKLATDVTSRASRYSRGSCEEAGNDMKQHAADDWGKPKRWEAADQSQQRFPKQRAAFFFSQRSPSTSSMARRWRSSVRLPTCILQGASIEMSASDQHACFCPMTSCHFLAQLFRLEPFTSGRVHL